MYVYGGNGEKRITKNISSPGLLPSPIIRKGKKTLSSSFLPRPSALPYKGRNKGGG